MVNGIRLEVFGSTNPSIEEIVSNNPPKAIIKYIKRTKRTIEFTS